MYGWMGKIALADLTNGVVRYEALEPGRAQNFLGGRGLGVSFLTELVPPEVKPLDPENVLIFAVGPLTATKAPTAGRTSLTTKSPLTGACHDSNVGGIWGVKLKKAGFDALIIKGKSAQPVYLAISDHKVEIKDGTGLAGMDTYQTADLLYEENGKEASVLAIGPAGENLVLFASITADKKRSFGRGGVGAVMGSKNLKAIVAQGSQEVKIADQELFDFVAYESGKIIKSNPITAKGLPEFGTGILVNIFNQIGALPTRNFQESTFAGAAKICGEAVTDQFLVRKQACWGCSIACGRLTKTANEEGHGPEYETLYALGSQCGIDDLQAIAEANYLCNRLGLDTISTGVTIACAMELSEKGLIQGKLAFGQASLLKELILKIAYREGLGDELALGSQRFARKYNNEYYAMQVKGMELPAYDPRGIQGQGLAYATSNRGGCHLRGNMMSPEVLGSPKMIDRFATRGKAGILIVMQHTNAVMDSLVVCKFTGFAIGDEYYARMLKAVTGIDYRPQDLQRVGERIWNLEKLYNLRQGFSRADDTLPERLLEEPVAQGPSQGRVVQLGSMLEEYYRFRGWDQEGIPSPGKRTELGLGVAEND